MAALFQTGVMEHSELVQEMWRGEWMSTGERLSLARRRRQAQLKAWSSREAELAKQPPQPPPQASIRFTDSVVLLEAASRNDIDEGETVPCTLYFLLIKFKKMFIASVFTL